MKLAVVGAAGFIGQAVCAEAQRGGAETVPISAPRLVVVDHNPVVDASRTWIDRHGDRYEALVRQLCGVDVIVNAAGLARPESAAVEALYGANAALPGVLAQAAADAGVRRMVHVSSAAVQGRRDPLDESTEVAPTTPYARSKALGEALLLERQVRTPQQVALYRPTSVQGADRPMTRKLVKLASLPILPVSGAGDAPLPVALVENVAAGIVFVCRSEECPQVVLQPWEGMTARSLLHALGPARVVPVPRPLMRVAMGVLYQTGRTWPRLGASARRLDILVFGQKQDARALPAMGFAPPVGPEGYARLAAQVRRCPGAGDP